MIFIRLRKTIYLIPKDRWIWKGSKIAFARFLKHWADHDFGSWTVRLKASGKTIGFGGLSYRLYGDELRLNLGYRFDKDAWGNGYATGLSQYSIAYAFSVMNRDKIFAIVRPANAASIRVLEKCNMKLLETLNDVPNEEESLVYIIER
jgi:RimJ/RimL family protein N-acetyltransferase